MPAGVTGWSEREETWDGGGSLATVTNMFEPVAAEGLTTLGLRVVLAVVMLPIPLVGTTVVLTGLPEVEAEVTDVTTVLNPGQHIIKQTNVFM